MLSLLHSQISFPVSFVHTKFPSRNITLSGYIGCYIDYNTSPCDDCPTSCLSFNSSDIIVDNKILSNNIDKVFENQLRQISELRFNMNQSEAYTANIYLYSLLIKNQLKLSEVKLIEEIINKSQTANSLVSLGKDIKAKLNLMISDNNSSPIAISIVKIISKSVDLLINGDNIISTTGA